MSNARVLPRGLLRVVDRAVARERADGHDAAADALLLHYTERMPQLRVEQAAHPLMQAPLRWERLPRLRGAIERLISILDAADVDASGALQALRAESLAELHAATYYGGAMPMLYAYPADLAYFASRGLGIDETIDRYLTAPVIHELCHLDRERAGLAPHLDECIAGWLGVHVLPEFAYPAPGHDDALYASPWLAQVGQALVRAFGLAPVLRAHAGHRDELWERSGSRPQADDRDVPPERSEATLRGPTRHGPIPRAFLDAEEQMYWHDWEQRRSLHLLSDTLAPRPWLALVLEHATLQADPEADRAIVRDALRAMCLVTTQIGGSFRTRTVVPSAPIVIEPGKISTAAKTALDTVPPWYWLPPTVDVRERREVTLTSIEEIPALAAALVP